MRRGWGSVANSSRRWSRSRRGRRYRLSTVARVSSISLSYCTPEGQLVTQAMQPRQRSKCSVTVGFSVSVPWAVFSISWMRPRGESISSLQRT